MTTALLVLILVAVVSKVARGLLSGLLMLAFGSLLLMVRCAIA